MRGERVGIWICQILQWIPSSSTPGYIEVKKMEMLALSNSPKYDKNGHIGTDLLVDIISSFAVKFQWRFSINVEHFLVRYDLKSIVLCAAIKVWGLS